LCERKSATNLKFFPGAYLLTGAPCTCI